MARIANDHEAAIKTVYAVCLNSASERPDAWVTELAPGEPYSKATGAHGTLSAVYDNYPEAVSKAREIMQDW